MELLPQKFVEICQQGCLYTTDITDMTLQKTEHSCFRCRYPIFFPEIEVGGKRGGYGWLIYNNLKFVLRLCNNFVIRRSDIKLSRLWLREKLRSCYYEVAPSECMRESIVNGFCANIDPSQDTSTMLSLSLSLSLCLSFRLCVCSPLSTNEQRLTL